MSQKKLIPIYSRDEIPRFENDAEYAKFWDTHEITEALVDETRRERERLGLPLRGRRATWPVGQDYLHCPNEAGVP